MLKDILAAIDAQIARLEQVKTLLSASGAVTPKRKPDRPVQVASAATPRVQKRRKRRKMSADSRERIRQAQIKCWAAIRETPKEKKKAAKAA